MPHSMPHCPAAEESTPMDSHEPELKGLFWEAVERLAGSERAIFLDEACRGDEDLRAAVEELLAAHDRAGRFLAQAPAFARMLGDPRAAGT
jgi:hypothetical protein